MQTILGSGGAIGNELATVLRTYTKEVRLVSRNPKPIHQDDELVAADLTLAQDAERAIKGSDVVYLTVGLPYKTRVWRKKWPIVMRNVIDACIANHAKLVFIDNMYLYDPEYLEGMNEKTPVRPSSRKGKIRKRIARMLINEMRIDNLEAIIARSADFYGPSIQKNSILTEMVFKRLAKGKKAIWPVAETWRHSFTYTPDAAKAIALLGNTPEAYNKVWHLPTAPEPPTGSEWVAIIAEEMGTASEYRIMPKVLIWTIGLIVPVMREIAEILYQYDRDYVFDSSKFEKYFHFSPTPYIKGVREIIESDYNTTAKGEK